MKTKKCDCYIDDEYTHINCSCDCHLPDEALI